MSRAVRGFCSIVLLAAAVACEKPSNLVVEPKQPVLHKRTDVYQMVAHVMHGRFEDAKATVLWTTADPNIVTVDERGVIKGHHSGITDVTATSEGISASVPVEVLFPEKITAIQKVDLKYEDDDGFDPKVVVTSYNDIVLKESPVFETKDDKICRVDRNGVIHPGNAGATQLSAHLDGLSVAIDCTVAPEVKGKKR